MASSRTGTARWMRVRDERRRLDFDAGLIRCPLCGVHLDWEYSRRPNSAEVDHIVPHSKGGQDVLENTRTICRLDNQRLGGASNRRRERPVIEATDLEASSIW